MDKPIGKLDQAFGFQQDALRIRAQRQELIAANIANADTPNFKARDIDFRKAMQAAQAGQLPSNVNLAKTDASHLPGIVKVLDNQSAGPGDPLFRNMMQGSVDGNTVDMDVERNQFVDNAIRYEASINMVNGKIKQLLTAIQS